MKKSVTVFAFFVAMVFMLSGCITWSYKFDDLRTENIESICIYDMCEYWYDGFDSKKIISTEPFYTFEKDRHGEFLTELKKLEFGEGVILFAASDPSFSYGEYVVRFTFSDGSYKLMSCMGFNETFDKNNKPIDSDHFGCDVSEWNDLIYRFTGERSVRIGKPERVLPVDSGEKVREILNSKIKINKPEKLSISVDYIISDGVRYTLGECDEKLILQNGEEYYEISGSGKAQLKAVLDDEHIYKWVLDE